MNFTSFRRSAFARELLIFLGFVLLTTAMTWPWVTRLRDAAIDGGDPYVHSWVMWWGYYQTFHNPLHLFDANIFYPVRYTFAFTDNDYGISLLFFPLYAIGLRPLTVNSIATFLGFAFSGYGAFRLARTLSGSTATGWISGIIFAFIPYRFHVMSQITYVFAGWIPLTLEALVLFAREHSWKRAIWLGIAFTMNGLSCLSWLLLSLPPLTLTALFLIVRHSLWRDRTFWVRVSIAAAGSIIALLPFLWPYLYVSRAYGFTWGKDVIERNSPSAVHWLVCEYRNRLWKGFGDNLAGGRFRLFPGLLPLVLGAASLLIARAQNRKTPIEVQSKASPKAVVLFDSLAVLAAIVALLSAGWASTPLEPGLAQIFELITVDRALLVCFIAILLRLSLAYPWRLQRMTGAPCLLENIRTTSAEVIWIGLIWTITGFFMSLGMNSWFYRTIYDFVFVFHAMREPSRAAMIASLGLAVLGGVGATKISDNVSRRVPRIAPVTVILLVAVALLFELRVAPLRFIRGAVYPDEVTLRLKETPMRGGIVELPTGGALLPHLYMLRAADHAKPLINAVSTFVPKHAWEIESLSKESPISVKLLDALEKVPASYLVIHNPLLEPNRREVYETFLISAVSSGRLRFVRRYGSGDDLYAIVKTEPNAKTEGPLPFGSAVPEWSVALEADSLNLLRSYTLYSQSLYRVLLVSSGELPKYSEFIEDAKIVGRGVVPGFDEGGMSENLKAFCATLTERAVFKEKYGSLDNQQYVERLSTNAGLQLGTTERDSLISDLNSGKETRSSLLLKLAEDPRLIEKERSRSIVLLHYFGYLRRNPDDAPDGSMTGFNYWVSEVQHHGGAGEDLARSFAVSGEYLNNSKKAR